jgi:hypothetical protein
MLLLRLAMPTCWLCCLSSGHERTFFLSKRTRKDIFFEREPRQMNSETLMKRCGATRFFTIFGRGDYLSRAGRCAVENFFFFFFFFATCCGAHIARHVQPPPIAEIEPMHKMVLCACFSAVESDARALTGRLTSLLERRTPRCGRSGGAHFCNAPVLSHTKNTFR